MWNRHWDSWKNQFSPSKMRTNNTSCQIKFIFLIDLSGDLLLKAWPLFVKPINARCNRSSRSAHWFLDCRYDRLGIPRLWTLSPNSPQNTDRRRWLYKTPSYKPCPTSRQLSNTLECCDRCKANSAVHRRLDRLAALTRTAACYGNSPKPASDFHRRELVARGMVGTTSVSPLASPESITDIKVPLGQSRQVLFIRGTLNDSGSEQS